ncbi:hypothetical protein SBY92_004643 [Candida maltosa Xu316]|uniref:Uncharacterized protein n=1 Tax=Candida maltosa (strain Xu316) TaxID=1245528 RepID=M3HJW0_CANMX|nr:hypothetical protein G210_1926 [Candida maltosa Xu316]
MSTQQLSFAQTYLLASKVRSKLTKEAQSPKSSLRNLVVQANMLDNIMDYISDETKRRTEEYQAIRKSTTTTTSASVQFAPSPLRQNYKTSVTEYEIDSESDEEEEEEDEEEQSDEELLDSESPRFNGVYYEQEEEEDSDDSEGSSFYSSESDSDDYYIYSDSDEIEEDVAIEATIPRTLPITSYKSLPTINLSLDTIDEHDEEEEEYISGDELELPELADNISSSEEDDDEIEIFELNRINLSSATTYNKKSHNNTINNNDSYELSRESNQQQQPISLFKNENISLEHVF